MLKDLMKLLVILTVITISVNAIIYLFALPIFISELVIIICFLLVLWYVGLKLIFRQKL